MGLFVVSYDLKEGQDYDPLIENLKHNNAVKALESFWLVDLNNTAAELVEHFKQFLPTPEQDKLMVVPFENRPRFTRAFSDAAKWITAHF